jgi:hypothetical protein
MTQDKRQEGFKNYLTSVTNEIKKGWCSLFQNIKYTRVEFGTALGRKRTEIHEIAFMFKSWQKWLLMLD